MIKKNLLFPPKDELHSRMQLKQKDQQLLQMMFAVHVTPNDKAVFFKDLNIEKEPMEFNLMLAHLCHRHGSLGVPSTIIPRVRGVARFYLFKNAALFSSFGRLGTILNQANIPMLLLKGSAIKAYYDPYTSRCLVDVDFAVPEERLNETIKIASSQGYYDFSNAFHSVDMKQLETDGTSGRIDIHHCLFKTSYKRSIEEELTDGAKLIQFFGTEVWIPSPENLILHLLENEFFNLCCVPKENRRRFKWIYDCGMVLCSTSQFDWKHVVKNAKKYFIHDAVKPMLSILADYLPQYVPQKIIVDNYSFQCPKHNSEMEKNVIVNLRWRSEALRRHKLRSEGKKLKSFFLLPFHVIEKYRMLRHHGKVHTIWEFILLHCEAKNFREVISWLLSKLHNWIKTND